ncbi:MAG TPA: hypothetical protein VGN37_26020 [Actinocatenispora sp.]
MPLTRRGVLFGSAAVALGFATSSCGLVSTGGRRAGFPGTDEVTDALRDLVKKAGRDSFQKVDVSADGLLGADLLLPDGSVQTYSFDKSWSKDHRDKKSEFTPPVSVRVRDLPLRHLAAFARAPKTETTGVIIDVDYAGKIRVKAEPKGSADAIGLKPDGTGTLPECDPETVRGVRSAVAEIVATYGTRAERIGSFNGFVHIDANVAGCRAGVRIIREPRLAAQANFTQETPFDASRIFDPSGFDPTMAVTRKATIATEARVDGKVWDWEYRRPDKGRAPQLSYGIGPSGPDTRVWLDATGKIVSVSHGECPKNTAWCPA